MHGCQSLSAAVCRSNKLSVSLVTVGCAVTCVCVCLNSSQLCTLFKWQDDAAIII